MNQEQIDKLFEDGHDILHNIATAKDKKVGRFEMAWQIIRQVEPPPSWVKEVSGTSGVYYMEIELVEALMTKLFEHWYISYVHFSEPIILKTGVAVTVEVTVKYADFDGKTYREAWGIATEYAQNAQGLVLATPKAKAMAFKNACREIGALLGRNLNRDLQDERSSIIVISPTDAEKEKKITEELEDIKKNLERAKYYEDAVEYLELTDFKLGWMYNMELKNIVNSKPRKEW